MRCPSEYFLSRFLTFHSISAGGFLEPPPKYMSYSTLSRRSWSSSTLSSSSIAKGTAPFPISKPGSLHGEHLRGIYHRPPRAPTCSRYRDLPATAVPYSGPLPSPVPGRYRALYISSHQSGQPESQAFHPLGNCI